MLRSAVVEVAAASPVAALFVTLWLLPSGGANAILPPAAAAENALSHHPPGA
jgi:hypothetical protein